jgi:hypothetical protein
MRIPALLLVRKEIKCDLRRSFVAFLFDLSYGTRIDARINYGVCCTLSIGTGNSPSLCFGVNTKCFARFPVFACAKLTFQSISRN